MKPLFFIFFLIIFLQSFTQQSKVIGVVSIFNSETVTGKRQYVSNAQVEDDFNKAQPTVTDVNGQFKLIYVGVDEKQRVSFQIKKPGLQVVNIDALDAIAGQNEFVKITMANPDSISEYRRKIYNVGKTEAEKRLESLIRRKNKDLRELQIDRLKNIKKINELATELTQLDEQRKKIEEQAMDLAKRYAPVNLDDASPLFRSAFEMFQNGKLDSSLILLENAKLLNKVDTILIARERNHNRQIELNKDDSVLIQRSDDVGKALLLKGDLHKTRYEFDRALHCYEKLIKLDSLNSEYLFNYAVMLGTLNHKTEAVSYYLKILKIDSSTGGKSIFGKSNIAKIQENLAIIYDNINNVSKAENAFIEALKIRKTLAKIDSQSFVPDVALSLTNLGAFYIRQKNYEKAEATLGEALEIRSRLANFNPRTVGPEVAVTEYNLGSLFLEKKDYIKADSFIQNAFKILQILANDNPQAYDPIRAQMQNELGILYLKLNNYTYADAALQEALQIRRKLAKGNLEAFEPEVAQTLTNIGNLNSNLRAYKKAEAAYLEALEIRKRLAKNEPQLYEAGVAIVKMNLGVLYNEVRNYSKSKFFFTEALEIYRHLVTTNPETYRTYLATTLNNLGLLYLEIGNSEEGEIALIESLNIFDKLMEKYPKVYLNEMSRTSKVLLGFYMSKLPQTDFLKKTKTNGFETVESILFEQSQKDKSVAQMLSMYYGNRAWNLLLALKFKEGERIAKRGLAIFPANTWIKKNVAHSLLLQGKYQDALKIYQELKFLINEDGISYSQQCLEDLNALQNKGIVNTNVNKIREFFKK